ncbi:hypothetical protein IU501_17005 [Nocardia otitidiscaviarum]|uniref:hypothetical protein n=1 Tax=Nocardia otitidiscaviarum TaxID=1823 RepID=UPI0004A73536|nr:hypothetical protein [Nocardia otitidiscaviarum]MBF6134697.1 hypothetical protein [Nocardia otitidiscaviarum]MBF6485677.1 hypothetical protein [Nocardia otitidiscaviarum]
MREFLTATLTFPTVVFSFALIVVVAYWLAVLAGGADPDLFDTDSDTGGSAIGDRWGLSGVPVSIIVSILIALAWFLCLAGATLTRELNLTGFLAFCAGVAVLVVAVPMSVLGTRAIVVPLRRLFAPAAEPSRNDLVGRVCVIRTGRVGPDFGQAELISPDGSSAIIQVRQSAQHAAETPLAHGVSAIVYDYDSATETFLVAPLEGI